MTEKERKFRRFAAAGLNTTRIKLEKTAADLKTIGMDKETS
jgi:hypothetical protein